ncbi:hypothetical protein ELH21_10665 [Rhizobium leguminosarum]|uniref:hypothetical protein n=1 Tax=Rhizobium leguminosarum TaxID=384 RepID=UPI00102F9732|nr:hypothetical protein [Rhizobium leguminosarum]TBD04817.1 hypothetical protein ELH21_10665 [Rhizobium leguminosarum]
MLRPPLCVFIAHRTGSPEFMMAEAAVRECKRRGFRVQPIFINNESVPFSTNVSEKVFRELERSKIALVLLSKDKKISGIFSGVPSLAVVFEWGYLSSVIGEDRHDAIQILKPGRVLRGRNLPEIKTVEMPKDLKTFTEWLESYLRNQRKLKAVGNLFENIRKETFVQAGDIGSVKMTEEDLMIFFRDEMSSMEDVNEIIIYIYERIFFDVYFDDKNFWRNVIRDLLERAADETSKALLMALQLVLQYTSGSWRQKKVENLTKNDKTNLFNSYVELCSLENQIEFKNIDPIFAIVIKNYIGLFLSRPEIADFLGDDRTLAAFEHFREAEEISSVFEVGPIRFWQGFIHANIASLLMSGNNSSEIPEYRSYLNWSLVAARDARRNWLEAEMPMPHFLRDIFQTEYFSALQRLSSIYDGDGGIFKQSYDNEFGAWKESSQASRFKRVRDLFENSLQKFNDLK